MFFDGEITKSVLDAWKRNHKYSTTQLLLGSLVFRDMLFATLGSISVIILVGLVVGVSTSGLSAVIAGYLIGLTLVGLLNKYVSAGYKCLEDDITFFWESIPVKYRREVFRCVDQDDLCELGKQSMVYWCRGMILIEKRYGRGSEKADSWRILLASNHEVLHQSFGLVSGDWSPYFEEAKSQIKERRERLDTKVFGPPNFPPVFS